MTEQAANTNTSGASADAAAAGNAAGQTAAASAAAAPPIAWLPQADELTVGYLQNKGWQDDPAKVVNGYRELEKTFGAGKAGRTVVLPDENADAAEVAKFYDRLGRPQDPKGYEIKVPEGQAPDFANEAAGWMHEAGLNKKQGQALAEKWNAYEQAVTTKQAEAEAAGRAADVQALKVEWGAAHDQNLKLAQATRAKLGVSDEQVDKMASVLGLKQTIELFHKLGAKTGEAEFVAGSSAAPGVMTPAQAKAKIAELQADKAWRARYIAGGNKSAEFNELARLSQLANPEIKK